MNNSDLIVRALKNAGVTHGFGIPSGNVLPFIEAMRKGGIEYVLTAHEGSAAFAADVTGRMTNVPGLCIATLGPGATNLATGVGSAYLDRSPMIAITCNLNSHQLGRRIQMIIDHHALFRPITKATLAATFDNVADVIQQAITIATTEPMGPVHIDLPEDVSLANVTTAVPEQIAAPPLALAQIDEFTRSGEVLSAASRPIAIIGASAMRMKNPERIATFLEKNNIPFATTTMAKGLIDDDHSLALGCIERARRQLQRRLLQQSDLIIGIGYDTIEVEYEAWIKSVPLLAVDIETPDVADSVNLVATIVGDLDDSIARLENLAPLTSAWTEAEITTHRHEFQQALRPAGNGFKPHELIDTVREILPRDGILSFDVGAHTHQIASQWPAHSPRSFLITNGWSSMGFGLPGAIAAKIARPDLPVVCLLGDGCFQMTCGELAVAKRLNLQLPVVVIDDRWLSLIQIKQHRRNYEIYGSNVEPGDYQAPPSHYFGVPAIGVTDNAALGDALRTALATDGPTVIEAIVNADHYMETVFD
ncbi:hypothetical protein AB833_12865 [Chromatiales bacterium (ex Bugula neritina AB1)]|nr:hypothetical protein AB833_12865 [Chromatiales bacterium (ex Bugula neritina AB1)]